MSLDKSTTFFLFARITLPELLWIRAYSHIDAALFYLTLLLASQPSTHFARRADGR